jgi:hypothetical protein
MATYAMTVDPNNKQITASLKLNKKGKKMNLQIADIFFSAK